MGRKKTKSILVQKGHMLFVFLKQGKQKKLGRIYTISKIVKKGYMRGQVVYKVRWEGYLPINDTWEPVSHFDQKVIDAFEASLASRADDKKTDKIEDVNNCCVSTALPPVLTPTTSIEQIVIADTDKTNENFDMSPSFANESNPEGIMTMEVKMIPICPKPRPRISNSASLHAGSLCSNSRDAEIQIPILYVQNFEDTLHLHSVPKSFNHSNNSAFRPIDSIDRALELLAQEWLL